MTVPDGGPGYLGEALQRRGATLNTFRLDKGESVPDVSPYDMLLVMGGVMNANQENKHPFYSFATPD